jgi:hypothetical protein
MMCEVRRLGHTAFRVIAPLALTCGTAMTRPVLGRVWGTEGVSHWRFPTSDGGAKTGHAA